ECRLCLFAGCRERRLQCRQLFTAECARVITSVVAIIQCADQCRCRMKYRGGEKYFQPLSLAVVGAHAQAKGKCAVGPSYSAVMYPLCQRVCALKILA